MISRANLPALRPVLLAAIASLLLPAGCGAPNAVNIELRKQIQTQETKIVELQRRDDADRATILALQQHATTVPTLPREQLEQLFTVSGLQLGRLSGGFRPDPNLPADTMLKIYAVPIDEAGDPIKAAGSFRIDLFDLDRKPDSQIGQWDFDLATTKSRWFGQGLLYTYILECPWQAVPTHAKLLARITFTDALTHGAFTVEHDVTVKVPTPGK